MYDDIYDDTMPGGDAPHYPVAEDDGFTDTLIIMSLAMALAFIVYYRQHRERAEQARRQREQQQQQQQQGGQGQGQGQQQGGNAAAAPNNGGFGQPPNPAFEDWIAGGAAI
jgi:SEL1 protein